MRKLRNWFAVTIFALGGTWVGSTAYPQSPAPSPSESEMMAKMMELANPGENHKLLAQLAGTWDYQMKFWMVPGAPPSESSGVSIRKPVLGGRYYIMDSTSKMQMPGADGKMHDVDFKGMSVEGYDNVKQKFMLTWIDNMGTGMLTAEGTYDPATRTFTYLYDEEMMPGMKTKARETLKITDKDHHIYEWYETRGGQETKTMEIASTRKK